ncbi:alginate lyase [Vibrio breoganii ZF-29]|nr:alginate lyase [Vibrio breoganii ZF-29]OEF82196.1 alginate lyase [Vibrio breoganii 1C10]PMF77451.1 alginate lyase [Vibrio breoganii]PMH17218.1 alginate lyase [Vibrio breoganii]PMM13109.1 alginate lyase [Vibrio breoganii]
MMNTKTLSLATSKKFALSTVATFAAALTISAGAQAETKAPSDKFDLLGWTISVPVDSNGDGKSDQIKENELAGGYSDADFFYLDQDGGMVFKAPIKGAKTSKNTTYTRSELREMMRRGNTSHKTKGVNGNNWVFSSAPEADLKAAAGVDGTLEATLKVDHVTTTGENWQVGRVIVGQIHANNDEPIRLYYRKLPQHETGSIYFAHEPREDFGDETWHDMIGNSLPNYWNQDATPAEPKDGIKLGEVFSYRINVTGNELTATIMREGKEDIVKTVDMSKSGYDEGGQYMYFKAGVYNQNKSGKPDDYVQATFYDLKVTH